MKIYDITLPVYEGMPVYKNKEEKQPSFEVTQDFETGKVHETRIHLDVHTGTHVDAHLHMLPDGETIESIPVEELIGPCKVFDLTGVEKGIAKEDIVNLDIQEHDIVLFKTKNSFDTEFNFEFIYVKEDAAKHLADIGVKIVGIDALGIERAQEGHPTHKSLMHKNVIIIEGLQLKEVQEGHYFMVAAPLKLQGTDASPARVILFDQAPQA
ncbi:cyclase family protein [Caldalkalibacillus salinus]|uniref:cyclase family protein n=1 Tax=Caldalkalibacillus salinus TaxID=2803787 RepID=UPI001920696F|nr:cyclase family protein [Caldalkalibacillus salinus]